MNNIDFNISELAEGAVQEKIDQDLLFIPFRLVKSKLQPSESVSALMMAGRDDSGYIHAAELKSSAPGQMYFDANDSTLKTDVGVPVEEIEDGGIIDFNSRKIK